MGGGTEAFPHLGKHCQHSDCNQLDFLPFNCDGCHKVFCLDHRTYKSHECPKSDHKSRTVVVCETCSAAIEISRSGEEKLLLEKHARSGSCDPSKKKKPTCSVRRCKEVLTFSNTSVCKSCQMKVCLRHRFPADHACAKQPAPSKVPAGGANDSLPWKEKFLAAFAARNGKDCGKTEKKVGSVSTKSNPSVKAC